MTEEQLILIGQVAHRIARVFVDVDPEDLRQELVVRWLESAQNTEERGTVGVLTYWDDEDEKRGRRLLYKTLERWAKAWCVAETAAIRGNSDYVQYDRYALRNMLPALNKPEAWGSLAATGNGGRRTAPAHEGGDSLASYADLTRAWDMLTDEQQELLSLRYVDELDEWQTVVMARYECTAAAATKRVSRAMDALERILAGRPRRDGPLDKRLVVSNAAAQSMTRSRYDG